MIHFRIACIAILLGSVQACTSEQIEVDAIVIAKRIYIGDSAFSTAEALVLSGEKILDFGTKEEILAKYQSKNQKEYEGYIYPGLIDAHSHFYGYSMTLNEVDLVGTSSMEEVVDKTLQFAQESDNLWIKGRGWDQNDWIVQGFPNNLELSIKIPDRPVILKRIDGHAALVNDKALELAGITASTKVNGGEVELRNGKPTGLLIDNAVNLIEALITEPPRSSQIKALVQAQKNCLEAGLTCITDAGLDKDIILLIDSLQSTGDLKIRCYLMCNPSEENFEYFGSRGLISKSRLQISSFKVYADGALGSYGALLRDEYCDKLGHHGFWLTEPDEIRALYFRIYNLGFQANTHCIGDSANHTILEMYAELLNKGNDRRWRIEHAQVVSKSDYHLFQEFNIIPSVQPSHATSDMYWAQNRLCSDRIMEAYAYKSLLKNSDYIALGTDFPVESISPLKTFFASVYRMDDKSYPPGGFRTEDALTAKETLLGMTLWAAKACMMDDRIGSLQKGKFADFIVTDKNLLSEKYTANCKILANYIAGEQLLLK